MKYALPKTQKMTGTYSEILSIDIKKSRLNMNFINNKNKNKTFLIKTKYPLPKTQKMK